MQRLVLEGSGTSARPLSLSPRPFGHPGAGIYRPPHSPASVTQAHVPVPAQDGTGQQRAWAELPASSRPTPPQDVEGGIWAEGGDPQPIGPARSTSGRSNSRSPAAQVSAAPGLRAPVLRDPRQRRHPAPRGPAARSLRSHHEAKVSWFAVPSREWGRGGVGWSRDPAELGLRAPQR